jgi:hypothetical protein
MHLRMPGLRRGWLRVLLRLGLLLWLRGHGRLRGLLRLLRLRLRLRHRGLSLLLLLLAQLLGHHVLLLWRWQRLGGLRPGLLRLLATTSLRYTPLLRLLWPGHRSQGGVANCLGIA